MAAPKRNSMIPIPLKRAKSGSRPILLEVELTTRSASCFFVGISGDLTKGGLFVATARKLPIGSPIDIALAMETTAFIAHGVVAWVREARRGGMPGLGVVFDEQLSIVDWAHVERLCAMRPPMVYAGAE
jgi:Tfp pilus assembly protein PilZ